MASVQGINECIELLMAAGCSVPRTTSQSSISAAWQVTMPDIDDDRLLAACVLYLRSEQASWWPKPGQILSLLVNRDDDTSGEDWGRVRSLRRKFGAREPVPFDQPRDFALAASRAEAQARWCGIQDSGGWRSFKAGASLEAFVTGYHRAVDSARSQIESKCKWSESVKMEVSDWLLLADARAAYRDLRMVAQSMSEDVPRDPTKPEPFRLHDDPKRERAMAAGLAAAGGWREIWPDKTTIPEALRASDAANRKAFIEAYRSAINRRFKTSEARRVAALVDLTSESLALPEFVKGKLG